MSSEHWNDVYEEAKLRDMLVQRRITRDGHSWDALPYAVQREVDSVRDSFSSAAAGGQVEASYSLGLIYYLGRGVRKDLKRAVGLLQAAADCGHVEASYLM